MFESISNGSGAKLRAKQLIRNTARTLLLIIAACFGIVQCTQAATLVSGAVTTNTSWTLAQSPYQVTADVVIQNGAMLTIEPGVTVGFDSGTNLTIGVGALNARGTAGQPILFTSSLEVAGNTPAAGDWGQIRFLDLTNDNTSIIEHAGIRYGHGISIQSASPTFNYLQIDSNLGAAINVDLNSSPKGIGNKASGNTLNGISVPPGDVLGTVTWGIKGIPYVVEAGVVSVGASPRITAVIPSELQQSQTVDAVITGDRLAGADAIRFGTSEINAVLTGAGSDTEVPVRITVGALQPLGNMPFDLKTAAGWVSYAGLNVIPLKPTITVNSVTPDSIRRSEIKSFVIGGASLLGAQVSVSVNSGLSVSNLRSTDTSVSFDLSATASAALGSQAITVKNSAVANGSAAMLVNVFDLLPRLNTATIPAAVIPDGVARPFQLSLSNPDTVDHTLNFSTLDPTIVSVSPASVTIPAGSISATVNIAGLKPGYTMLNVTSPTLTAASKQVYATTLLNGGVVGPVLSAPTGVSVPYTAASVLPSGTVLPVVSQPVGVNTPFTASLSSVLPPGTAVPVVSQPVGVNTPFTATTSSVLPPGTAVPVVSQPVGVNTPFTATTSSVLPPGTAVPVVSQSVGVNTPFTASVSSVLPPGMVVPVVSSPVGVTAP
ncbi:MAG: hypothetical protein GW936_08245 [Gallionella sp.]|nr:hypothetical protein [Gallionella sp.]